MIVKTLYTLLILVTVALGVHAQTAVTPPVPTIPKRNTRAETTERAAAAASATNPAVRAKNVAVTATNAEAPVTVAAAPVIPAPPAPVTAPPSAIPAPSATGAAAATAPPTPAVGTAAATTEVSVTAEEVFPPGLLKFQDADLVQVLDIYQELTGLTVMRPAGLPAAKITIRSQTPLTRSEAIAALDTILAMNQITMIKQGDKFVKAVVPGTASQEAPRFSASSSGGLLDTTRYITRIVKLTNALPRDVAPALQPFAKMPNSIIAIDSAGILVLRDYEENIKRMLEMLEQIDVVAINEVDPVVIPIKYALAGDIAQVLGSLTAGGGGTTVGRQPNRSGLSTGGLGGGGGGGGFGQQGYGGQPGQQGYNQGNPQGGAAGGLNSSSAGRSSFANRLNQIVNKAAGGSGEIVVLGQTKIIADERTNSLLIFANKQDIATIRDIIEKLDVVLAQVIIEALIVEVTLGDNFELGFDYIQKGHRVGAVQGSSSINRPLPIPNAQASLAGTNATSSLNSFFNYFAKLDKYNLEASVTAAASDSKVRILSRPRVQTSHAVEANLFVGRTRPYPTGQSTSYGGSFSQIQQLQIGITLSVLPLINPDGLVVMDIRQKVQDVGKDIVIDGNAIPETIEREANAKVAVRDGETVMLGGFISSSASDSKGGVPFLKDIPILGNLFRSTKKNRDRVELMVLIRPTVLATPEIAARVATEEKNKLPDMMRAEREDLEVQKKGIETERRRQEKMGNALRSKEGFTETSGRPSGVSNAELEAEQKRQDRAHKELLRKEGFE